VTLSAMPHKPNRRRRTRAEMDRIRDAMVSLATENHPLTVRQLFYLMVSAGVIEKTEAEYKRTVIRLALDLRRSADVPWHWVVDRTRWFFKAKTFDSLADALEESARLYRRSLWTDADRRVQVWCESMSVAGIIDSETGRWDVPLYPGKGYSSHDFLRSAARDIADEGIDTVVYLLGDYDSSGRDIIRFVSKALREYADEVDPSVNIDFQTVAVTERQIAEWSLPSHPAKKTDSRHGRYQIDHAVELEAIPPDRLRSIVRECISQHIDPDALRRLKEVEAAERDTLLAIAEGGGRA
jgi:hypothetical protein